MSISPALPDAAETAAVLSLQETPAVHDGAEDQDAYTSTLSLAACHPTTVPPTRTEI
ncbi:hypothetical protein ACFV4P_01020 [Kitasatospora sp. NPDC059795]|uniref:hypothetical protein n=1 Tax=Kitasatospora sp. NPDC059795 TaxID=3346949 RepID=UPI00365ADB42